MNLERTSREFLTRVYADPQGYLIGMANERGERAWLHSSLVKQPVINDDFFEQPLLVTYDKDSGTAFIYDRQVADRLLTFEWQEDALTDQQTGSKWNHNTGRAVAGPLEGAQLELLPGIISYTGSWQDFHPDSDYFEKPVSSSKGRRPSRRGGRRRR